MSATNERFSLDCSPDAVIVAEASGKLSYANLRAAELFGLPKEELARLSLHDLFPAWPALEESLRAAPVSTFLAAGCRRDGSRFAAEVVAGKAAAPLQLAPLERAPGPLLVPAPPEPPAVGTSLVVAVRERPMPALEGTNSGAAEAALQQQREFFSLFNHDVRQSLQAIQFLSESLSNFAPETVAVITEILASVRRLLDSVLRLNDTGLVRPSAESCSLGEVLRTLRRELEPVARRKGLDLCFEDTTEQLRTDPVLLRELLQNLVSNAIRYTHEGRVRVSCHRNEIASYVEIADTGSGMSPEHLEHIFARRPAEAAAGSAHHDGGFGLGLVIVRRLADVLGYRIEAQSKLGQGSVFTVKIPLMGRFEPLLANGDNAPPHSEAKPHLASNGD